MTPVVRRVLFGNALAAIGSGLTLPQRMRRGLTPALDGQVPDAMSARVEQ